MIQKILFTILLMLFASFGSELLAAGMGMGMGMGGPCGSGPFPPCFPVPLDGGLSLLAGAGIVIGARKYKKSK